VEDDEMQLAEDGHVPRNITVGISNQNSGTLEYATILIVLPASITQPFQERDSVH
jgi:hypothetical protein